MAIPFLNDINLSKNELQNAVIQNLGTAPSNPLEGQIYFDSTAGDKSLYFWDGSNWIDVGGDIKRVQVTADDSNAYNVTSGEFLLTISGDTGISTTLSGSTLEIDLDDTLTVSEAGSYGSSTSIPTFTVNQQGQLTAVGSASVSTTLDIAADSGTDDGVRLGTDTLTISGTSNEIETSVSGDTITVGLPNNVTISNDLTVTNDLTVNGDVTLGNSTSDTITINGDLIVSGTQTTKASETVLIEDNIIVLNSNEAGTPSANSGIEVERGTSDNVKLQWNETDDNWEYDAYNHASDPALVTYKIPRTYAATIGDASNTSYAVTHNLGTKDVIVQIYDISSNDTVFADVVRTNSATVTLTFGTAPALNDIRVLISTVG